ncbi:hypothetical protein BCEP27_30827 [Burkholderia cepacia]
MPSFDVTLDIASSEYGSGRNPCKTVPLEEPIPTAPGLVCGHPFKCIFSRAEKSFSRADGIHIHTFTPEIRFSPR